MLTAIGERVMDLMESFEHPLIILLIFFNIQLQFQLYAHFAHPSGLS